MNTYAIFKLIHILAVIIFLGNIITGLFWMKAADKTRDPSIISFAIKIIIRSDKWFTIPGVIIITAFGIITAIEGGLPLLRTGWIAWSILLFSLSGIFFGWKVGPLQSKIRKLTGVVSSEHFNWQQYQAYLKQWEFWGSISMLTPLVALVLMVLKIPARFI